MESFESACENWDRAMKKFAEHISHEIMPITNIPWIYEKKRTKVCSVDDNGKKKRCAVGARCYSNAVLNNKDAYVVWNLFQQFAKAEGLDKIKRLQNNEKELGRYDFGAENTITGDEFSCSIYLLGKWNKPHISLAIFIGPRYRKIDLPGPDAFVK